jgi:hypothetical protein
VRLAEYLVRLLLAVVGAGIWVCLTCAGFSGIQTGALAFGMLVGLLAAAVVSLAFQVLKRIPALGRASQPVSVAFAVAAAGGLFVWWVDRYISPDVIGGDYGPLVGMFLCVTVTPMVAVIAGAFGWGLGQKR